MNTINIKTPSELAGGIAENLKHLRKSKGLSQKELAAKAGISFASLRRFEECGEISLKTLLKIAIVLDCADEFEPIFTTREIASIQEIIDGKI